ncbi:MAG: hypothetical protein ACTSWW_06420 [Promethearchaeota archaeon]
MGVPQNSKDNSFHTAFNLFAAGQKCSRCLQEHPLFSHHKLSFCLICRRHFHSLILVDEIHYGKAGLFYCTAHYWDHSRIYFTTFSPKSHLVVVDDSFLMPVSSLPIYRKTEVADWSVSFFYAEVYRNEWDANHFRQMLALRAKEPRLW